MGVLKLFSWQGFAEKRRYQCHEDDVRVCTSSSWQGLYRSLLPLHHQRHAAEALRTVVEFAVAVAKMLNLEAIGLVLFIIEGVELVNGDLVELVKVGPPLPAAAEVVVEEGICALLAKLGQQCHLVTPSVYSSV